jgi:hypothetical protein
MSSAIQLTAASSIINGQGLGVNPTLTTQIYTYQHQAPLLVIANIFANAANASSGLSSNLANALSNIGVGVSRGHFLIDFYPTNIAATSSGNVSYYFAGNANTASFSRTLTNQANQPFVNGLGGFANVFTTVYGYASSVFDTVSSVTLLKNKTYNQSGLGFSGPADLATNGLSAAPLLANVVSKFGTMYDINNLSGIGNPYIFGQNLLNQGFGQFGGLSSQLSNAGLDTDNLLQVPQSSTSVTHVSGTASRNSILGSIDLPVVNPVTTSTIVSGTSSSVVVGVYQSIAGGALQSIASATGSTIANVSITTLADYLNLNKVVSSSAYSQLSSLGIVDLNSLGSYLQYRLGTGHFSSWNDMANFLGNVSVPTLSYTTANANSAVLSSNTISTLGNLLSTGTGPFGNPVMMDYLGAAAGVPYTTNFATINANYGIVANSTTLLANLTTLNTAVSNYVYNSGNIGNVTLAVTAVNAALNSLSSGNAFVANSWAAHYNMLSRLNAEVINLADAGVVYTTNQLALIALAQRIGPTSADTTQLQTYQFVSNIVTNNAGGDTIRAAIAESLNTALLSSKGINVTNDPNPASILVQAATQNIPLNTYITQNM